MDLSNKGIFDLIKSGIHLSIYRNQKMKNQKIEKIENQENEIKIFGKEDLEKNPKIKFNPDDKIIILSNGNPKRGNKNSFNNFQIYLENPGISIKEFEELFLKSEGNIQKKLKNPISWIKWDISKGFIGII
jgi:hypothetical protein